MPCHRNCQDCGQGRWARGEMRETRVDVATDCRAAMQCTGDPLPRPACLPARCTPDRLPPARDARAGHHPAVETNMPAPCRVLRPAGRATQHAMCTEQATLIAANKAGQGSLMKKPNHACPSSADEMCGATLMAAQRGDASRGAWVRVVARAHGHKRVPGGAPHPLPSIVAQALG